MLTQIWLELIPTTWSPVTARPTWAPTDRTPGSDRNSLLTRDVIRCVSAWDVPARVDIFTSNSLSLREGSNDCPRNGNTAMPPTTTMPTAMNILGAAWI